MAAGVDVVFYPSPAIFQKRLKDRQGFFPPAVIVELPAIVELMPGLQNFSRVQLGLVDPQVAIWIAGACFAVGDGEISIKNLSYWSNRLMNSSIPARFLISRSL